MIGETNTLRNTSKRKCFGRNVEGQRKVTGTLFGFQEAFLRGPHGFSDGFEYVSPNFACFPESPKSPIGSPNLVCKFCLSDTFGLQIGFHSPSGIRAFDRRCQASGRLVRFALSSVSTGLQVVILPAPNTFRFFPELPPFESCVFFSDPMTLNRSASASSTRVLPLADVRFRTAETARVSQWANCRPTGSWKARSLTSVWPVTRAQSQKAVTIKVASTCFEFRGSTGLHGVFSSPRWAQNCSPSGFSIRYWVSWPGVHWAATTTPSP
jgi:hypothetical protein